MRRFANRSRCFMDAYSRGLNRSQAAWAARKYRSHRTLPENLMTELVRAHIVLLSTPSFFYLSAPNFADIFFRCIIKILSDSILR